MRTTISYTCCLYPVTVTTTPTRWPLPPKSRRWREAASGLCPQALHGSGFLRASVAGKPGDAWVFRRDAAQPPHRCLAVSDLRPRRRRGDAFPDRRSGRAGLSALDAGLGHHGRAHPVEQHCDAAKLVSVAAPPRQNGTHTAGRAAHVAAGATPAAPSPSLGRGGTGLVRS